MKNKCKVCGAEKNKWAKCKNIEAHDKIFEENIGKLGRGNNFDVSGTHNDAAIIS